MHLLSNSDKFSEIKCPKVVWPTLQKLKYSMKLLFTLWTVFNGKWPTDKLLIEYNQANAVPAMFSRIYLSSSQTFMHCHPSTRNPGNIHTLIDCCRFIRVPIPILCLYQKITLVGEIGKFSICYLVLVREEEEKKITKSKKQVTFGSAQLL